MAERPHLRKASIVSLVGRIAEFFDQEAYQNWGVSIAKSKPVFRILFSLVRCLGRGWAGNFSAIFVLILFYPNLRLPDEQSRVFQLGLSWNNERVFRRLNRILAEHGITDIVMNGAPPTLWRRLAIGVSAASDIGRAARVLASARHQDAFVHTQQILGSTALVLFDRTVERDPLRVVCIANDHSPVCMALLETARRKGIATCYVQHAPVTHYFPPLDHDLSILFDHASVEAYRKAGLRRGRQISGRIVLLAPFDTDFRSPVSVSAPFDIGVCISFLPDLDALFRLVSELAAMAAVRTIALRPHPRSKATFSRLTALPKVVVRMGSEDPMSFFEAVGIVLVPNSGVAIEALHSGRATFYTPGVDKLDHDYYGFVEAGILPEFDTALLSSAATLTAFFDAAWQDRFCRYDVTAKVPREHARDHVIAAFEDILSRRPAPRCQGERAGMS